MFDLTECSDEQIVELIDGLNARGCAVTLNIPATKEGVAYFFSRAFTCQHCGRCCDGSLKYTDDDGIEVEETEIREIASYLDVPVPVLQKQLKTGGDGCTRIPFPCTFFSRDTMACGIYPVRPIVCRYFPLEKPVTIRSAGGTLEVLTADADCRTAREVTIRLYKEIRDANL